jgi:hypothetical protein
MYSPGANRSTQVPKSLSYQHESDEVEAATVIAAGAAPGEVVQAS